MNASLVADFAAVLDVLRVRGWPVQRRGEAIWQVQPREAALRLILSAGVHGDEIAPLLMLQQLLQAWGDDETLRAELLLCVGNPLAVAAGRRFVGRDLNRLFGIAPPNGGANAWAEGARAAVLQAATARFLDGAAAPALPALHLDLHSTIRASLKPRFAVIPGAIDGRTALLLDWLGQAGLDATVLSSFTSTTFSGHSARLGAIACTVELGQIGDGRAGFDARFASALARLLRGQGWPAAADTGAAANTQWPVYAVREEIVRSSERFVLHVSDDAPNFQPLALGAPLWQDGGPLHRVTQADACILFPNPQVAVGLRAGLLLTPLTRDERDGLRRG